MKIFGGVLLGLYALLNVMNVEMFSDDERGPLPPHVRDDARGLGGWFTGFSGGK